MTGNELAESLGYTIERAADALVAGDLTTAAMALDIASNFCDVGRAEGITLPATSMARLRDLNARCGLALDAVRLNLARDMAATASARRALSAYGR